MKSKIKMFRARHAFNGIRETAYESIANSMLKDKVPLRDCLTRLAERARKDGDPVAPLYAAWIKRMGDVQMRGQFSMCIKPDVPPSDYMVLRGFEQSGNLASGILYQSSLIARMRKMQSEFKSTLITPVISFVALSGVSAFFASAANGFLDAAPMEKWPASSQMMFKYTIFMDAYIYIIYGVFAAVFAWLYWAMGNWGAKNVKLRHKLDNYLPFVMYRDFTAFASMVILSSLIASGMPLKIATQTIMESGTPWVRSYIKKILRRLGDASISSPAAAFDVGFFPKKIYYRVLDASEQGGFDEAIRKIAEDSFEQMEREMKARAFKIDQIVKAISGVVAGILAVGLTSAIGQITSIMKSL